MLIYIKGWKILLAAMLAAFTLTYLVIESRPSKFSAEVAIQVIPIQAELSTDKFLAQIAAPFASEIFSPALLGEVVDELGLDGYFGISRERAMKEVSDHTRIYWKRGELSCRILVTTEEARLSAQLANALARAFVRSRIQDLLLSNLPTSPDLSTMAAVAESLGGKDLLASLPIFKQDPEIRESAAKLALLESLAESMKEGSASEIERMSLDQELRQMQAKLDLRKEKVLSDIRKSRSLSVKPGYRIQILQEAVPPLHPQHNQEALIYFLVGILTLGVTSCWLYLLSVLDQRIYSMRDLERYGVNFSYLGVIPRMARKARLGGVKELLAWHGTKTDLDDCFRYLRVAINFVASPGSAKILPITSGMSGEGKTFSACHLAASMALDRNRTLLVDADFQKPEIHQIFNIQNESGLSNYLLEPVEWETLVHASGISQLDLITAGIRSREARSMAESEKMRKFLEEAKKKYDRVVLHIPNLDRGGFEIVRLVGEFVLVAQAGRVTAEILRHVEHLTGPKVRALGLILNHQAMTPADLSYESYMYQLKIMPPEESL